MRRWTIFTAAAVALTTACGPRERDDALCEAGTNVCFDDPTQVLVCTADGAAWEVEPCPEGSLCFDGSCEPMECLPGTTECEAGGVATCLEDGSGWSEPAACSDGQRCIDGACAMSACEPGQARCTADGQLERCSADGALWVAVPCPGGTVCLEGLCLAEPCEPGARECGPSTLFVCTDGGQWEAEPCPDGQACVFGRCVECVGDGGCEPGEACVDGACVATPPTIVTAELPPAAVGSAYSVSLEAEGGALPYGWSLSPESALPHGLGLSADGIIAGEPTSAGSSTFTVILEDGVAATDSRELHLEVLPEGPVRITTVALPAAEHGLDYRTTLTATGGALPYGWQLLSGSLPAGLVLASGGDLFGVPDEVGDFPVTFRVIDGAEPPETDSADFVLTVEIAPLEIVGETEYDLLLTKIIVLPVLVPIIPYSTTLEARGGLVPYGWTLEDPPAGLGWIVGTWGLPDGMSLGPAGRLSGWVTDVSDAQRIAIPFGPELAGYFFYARVSDSQAPPDAAEAIFCLPTVAL